MTNLAYFEIMRPSYGVDGAIVQQIPGGPHAWIDWEASAYIMRRKMKAYEFQVTTPKPGYFDRGPLTVWASSQETARRIARQYVAAVYGRAKIDPADFPWAASFPPAANAVRPVAWVHFPTLTY